MPDSPIMPVLRKLSAIAAMLGPRRTPGWRFEAHVEHDSGLISSGQAHPLLAGITEDILGQAAEKASHTSPLAVAVTRPASTHSERLIGTL